MPATLLLTLALAGQVPQVLEVYDQNRDRTTLSVNLGKLDGTAAATLDLKLEYRYGGRIRPRDAQVEFVFTCAGKEWRYLNRRDLTIVADGTEIKTDPTYKGDIYLGGVSEIMTAPLPAKDFLEISGTTSFSGRLGGTSFRMTKPQREALREFAKCVRDPKYDPAARRAERARFEAALKAAADAQAADRLLAEARALDRANQADRALEAYRRVVREYPGTDAAKAAAARAEAMARR
jgi:hypothetical protein